MKDQVAVQPQERHPTALGLRWHAFVRTIRRRSVLLSASFALLFFIAIKHAVYHVAGSWRPVQMLLASGGADAITVGIIALAAGAVSHFIEVDVQQRLHDAAEQRRQLEALAAENAAVVRVCQAVALEFAQPLSGILAYSELLIARPEYATQADRYEVEGLREGALQMECLLETLRAAVSNAPTAGADYHVASEVAHAVAQPRPRLLQHTRTWHARSHHELEE